MGYLSIYFLEKSDRFFANFETRHTFASKFFKESILKQKMKKLFALLMVAGTFAMYSCGGEKKEETSTEVTVETPMDTTVVEAAPADTTTAPAADTTAPAAAH
jgi:hypothetical protein